MKAITLILFALGALSIGGCGTDKTVKVGEPGQKGVYKSDIDKAKAIGAEATTRIKQGERDVYGS